MQSFQVVPNAVRVIHENRFFRRPCTTFRIRALENQPAILIMEVIPFPPFLIFFVLDTVHDSNIPEFGTHNLVYKSIGQAEQEVKDSNELILILFVLLSC